MNLFIRYLCITACLCSWSSIDAKKVVEKSTELQELVDLKKEDKMSEATQVAAKHILVSTEQEAKDILKEIQKKELGAKQPLKMQRKPILSVHRELTAVISDFSKEA